MALDLGTVEGRLELDDKFSPELEKALGITADSLKEVGEEMERTAEKGREVDESLKQLGFSYENYFAALQKQVDAQTEAAASMDKMQEEALKMNSALEESSGGVGQFVEALLHGNIKEAISAFGELPTSFLAIGGAAYEAAVSVKELSDEAEQLQNKSLTLGLTTGAIQALDRLAEDAGVSSRAVEMSIIKMQRAAENNSKAFQALKLNPTDFFAAGTEEQLKMVADRMMEYGTAAERSHAMTELFGKGAALQLTPALKELAENGLPKMVELTETQIASLGELNNAIDSSSGAWTDLSRQFVAMLAEFPGIVSGLKSIANALNDMALFIRDSAIPAIRELKAQWEEVFAAINASSAESSAKTVQSLQAMKTAGLSVQQVLASGTIGGVGLTNEMMGVLEQARAQGKSIDDLIKKYGDAAKSAQSLAAENLKAADALREGATAADQQTKAHGATEAALKASAKAAEAYDKALVSALEKTSKAMDKHHEDMAKLILDWDKMKRAEEAAADATGFVIPKLPELGKAGGLDTGIGSTGTAGIAGANASKMLAEGFNPETIKKKLIASLLVTPAEADAILASLHRAVGSKTWGQTFSSALQQGIANLPNVILGAIQGGGDIGKAIGASLGKDIGSILGEKLGSKLTGVLGETLGKSVGALAGSLGSILGSLAGKGLDKLTGALGIGGNKELMKVNDLRDTFLAAQGGFEELQKKLVGLTNQDLVKKIFDAKTVDQFNSAVNETMSLLDTQAAAQQALNDAVDRYGFSIEELGPKFAQQQMDEQAGQLLQDFELLKASGIDVNTILEHMGPALNTFVQQSIAAGTAIPEAMRPVIEQLIASGQLLDENGNAYGSVEEAGITFAQTMDEKFTTLIDKITQMVNALLGIPTNVDTNVNVHTNYSSSGAPPPGGDSGSRNGWPQERNAFGGIVTSPTVSALGERGPEAIVPLSDMSQLNGGVSQSDLQSELMAFGARQTRSITKGVRDALLQSGRG